MLEFRLPHLGENIKSGNIVKINVSIGQSIKKDQPLLELETDKATIEVPSPSDGIIKEIFVKDGQELKIGEIILTIDAQAAGTAEHPKEVTEISSKTEPVIFEKTPIQPSSVTAPTITGSVLSAAGDVPAAPSVRRFAREIGIDLAQVPGKGPGGRISIEDIKAYAKQLNLSRGTTPTGPTIASQSLPDFSKWGTVERQPMNNIRKKTAQHLSYCWMTIPHVTQFDKADITELEKLRKRHSTEQRKLTITPFLLKVLASALKTFPQFNASIDMNTNEIIYKKYFHVGVAVDTQRGLLVPIIRDIDKKSIFQLAEELSEMAERARSKKTNLEELQGGSMSLTNLGGIGGTYFTPIVNWPEVAILGVSRGQMEAVYQDKHLVPRLMLPLCLSYDHRLIDGADGARFLRWICEAIEQPFLMELEGK